MPNSLDFMRRRGPLVGHADDENAARRIRERGHALPDDFAQLVSPDVLSTLEGHEVVFIVASLEGSGG